MRYLDLSQIDAIHQFVHSLVRDGILIDICILNAAVALPGARKTPASQQGSV